MRGIRQRYLVDALVVLSAPSPPVAGAVAAHVHARLDGTRVVDVTEGSEADAHDEEAEAGGAVSAGERDSASRHEDHLDVI